MERMRYAYGILFCRCRNKLSLFAGCLLLMVFSLSVSAAEYPADENSLFMALPQVNEVEVKGTVLDEKNNDPLIGVNVIIDGDASKGGVVTDVDGNFKLKVPAGTTKIVFSFIGYETREIMFYPNKLNNFRMVLMQESSEQLEEATVVAFGKQKKSSVISSITTITPKDLKVPSSNLTTALAGRLAGVIAYQRSGEPGQDNAEFFIRGVTSFGTGKVDPLILIDNIELSADDLSRLNPDDIEAFSILKDATATALYGARGANGVVLVTTKEGAEGKASISFRFENSFSGATKNLEIEDPITFMEQHNEAVRTRDPLSVLQYTNTKIARTKAGVNPYAYPTVDWKEMMLKKMTTNQRFNFNVSGGGKVARYYIAASYSRDNGVLKNNGQNNFNSNIKLNKYLVRSNININLTKTTEAAIRVSGTFDDYSGPIDGGSTLYQKAIFANPVLFPAVYEPDEANRFTKHPLFGNYGTDASYLNPYADMVKGYKEYSNTVVVAQIELKQDLGGILKGLKGRVLGNTTRNSYFDVNRSYNPFYYTSTYDSESRKYTLSGINDGSNDFFQGAQGTEYLNYNPGKKEVSSTLYLEASLSYNQVFKEVHDVSGMLVYTTRESLTGNAGTLQKSLPTRNMGLAGRFTYGYDGRYFAEFNFGYNGSERFDKDHRWGFFPSVGAGWLVSNEKFWQGKLADIVYKLKLKGTYGLVGNEAIGNADDRFFYLSEVNLQGGNTYVFGENFNNVKPGIYINRYANPEITWEIAHKTNLGVELGLFRSLDIQVDYFMEKRKNILQERTSIPSTMGLQKNISANIGEAKSHGVDISVDYQKVFNNDWWLTARGNFTYATSEFVVYEEPDYSATPWRSHIGQNIKQSWGYVAERLFVDEAEVANSPRQQFGEYMAGDIKYKDINKDGLVDERDQVPIGYPTTPEIIYGFGFSVGYKGWDLSCFFQGSARSSFWIDYYKMSPFINANKIPNERDWANGNNALSKFIMDSHWSEDHRDPYAVWPRFANYSVENNRKTNTWFMRDGSFLRMKSAELGYTLPQRLTTRAHIQKLRVYLSGTNLFTISKFKLWDPEMGSSGLGYPVQMVGNIGVQLTF